MTVSSSGLAALAILYLIWGSSFLAIRIAVTGPAAFAPFTLAGLRTLLAGLVLLGVALARGHSFRLPARAWMWLTATGLLLWVGGHTLILWAEQRLDSGLAALLFASSPLWAAALERWRGRRTRLFPLVTGFAGVALVLPVGGAFGPSLWRDGAVVLLSALFWALGTVMDEGPAKGAPIAVITGIQLTAAGLFNLAWAALAREAWTPPDTRGWLAFAYLTLFDTVVAFLAYAYAQRRLRVSWLMSFAYVNPVVAVALGALVLGEQLTIRTLAGMAVVLASVMWLFAKPKEAA